MSQMRGMIEVKMHGGTIMVSVLVTERRDQFGRTMLHVVPEAGAGGAWINARSLYAECETTPHDTTSDDKGQADD